MGHAMSTLTFSADKFSKKQIQVECDNWGNANADLVERNFRLDGLGSQINFIDHVFDDFEIADAYLHQISGNYKQNAVKFKRYPPLKPTTKTADLNRRIKEYSDKIQKLEEPHYKGVKQATVKCKACGSSLATAYCGKSYLNHCPVCRADLRPKSTLDKIGTYRSTIERLSQQLEQLGLQQRQKSKENPEIYWAVLCDVHT